MQWRNTQLGKTLAIHPETPPTLVVMLLWKPRPALLDERDIAGCMPAFSLKLNSIKSDT